MLRSAILNICALTVLLFSAISEPVSASEQLENIEQQYLSAKEEFGNAAPETLQALYNLSQALNSYRRFDEAEQKGRELLVLFESNFGKEHPNTGYALDIIATSLRAQGKAQEGIELRKIAYERIVSHFGPDHEMSLQRARGLAIDHAELGLFDEAKKILDENIKRAQKTPSYASFLNTKAFVLRNSEGAEQAILPMEELIELERRQDESHTSQFASNLYNLAQLYLETNKKQLALEASSEAGMIAMQTYGPDHPAAKEIFRFQTELREAKERGEF